MNQRYESKLKDFNYIKTTTEYSDNGTETQVAKITSRNGAMAAECRLTIVTKQN